jgi:hypothetical protein
MTAGSERLTRELLDTYLTCLGAAPGRSAVSFGLSGKRVSNHIFLLSGGHSLDVR